MTKHHTIKSTKHPKETMLLQLAVESVERFADHELEYLLINCVPLTIKIVFFFKFHIDLSVHDNPNDTEFGKKLRYNVKIAIEKEIKFRKNVMDELRRYEQENERLRLFASFSEHQRDMVRDNCTMISNIADNEGKRSTELANIHQQYSSKIVPLFASPMQPPALPFSSPIQNGTGGTSGPGPTSSASSTRASGLMGNGRGLSSATSHSVSIFSPPEKIESRKGDHNMDISPSNKTNGGFAALDPQLSVMDSESAKKRSSGVGGSPNNKDGPFLLPEQMQQSYWSKHKSGLPDFTQRSRTNQSLRPDHEKHSFGEEGLSFGNAPSHPGETQRHIRFPDNYPDSISDEEAKPPKSKKPNLRSTPPSMRNLRKTPPSMR